MLTDFFHRKKSVFDEEMLRLIHKDKAEALREQLDHNELWDHWQEFETLNHPEREQTTVYIQELRKLLAIAIEECSPKCTALALERTDLNSPITIRTTHTSLGHISKKEILAKGFKRVQRGERSVKEVAEDWIKRMEPLLISVRQEDAKAQKRVYETLGILREATSFDLPEFLKR